MAIGVNGVTMVVKTSADKGLALQSGTNIIGMTLGTAYISNVTTTVNGTVVISTH